VLSEVYIQKETYFKYNCIHKGKWKNNIQMNHEGRGKGGVVWDREQ
jgi:hypothetical protein